MKCSTSVQPASRISTYSFCFFVFRSVEESSKFFFKSLLFSAHILNRLQKMSETRETQPLLPIPNRGKPRIIGCCLAVLSAFTFALTNFLVKRWHLDFVDVLFSRASLQIIIFGPLLHFTQSRIDEEEHGDSRHYLKWALLVFQVCNVKFKLKIIKNV